MAKQEKIDFRAMTRSLGSESPADLRRVTESFFAKVGGATAFAEMLYADWQASPAGGMTRAKIYDLLLRMMQLAEKDTPKEDFHQLTDDDLARVAANLMTTIHDKRQADRRRKETGPAPTAG